VRGYGGIPCFVEGMSRRRMTGGWRAMDTAYSDPGRSAQQARRKR